ncbi:MAG TPA: hypothetical protein VG755_20530 [Nannocystaceae bacterium]|nr:hypothetical protein [Nannocystaceae bacterium]
MSSSTVSVVELSLPLLSPVLSLSAELLLSGFTVASVVGSVVSVGSTVVDTVELSLPLSLAVIVVPSVTLTVPLLLLLPLLSLSLSEVSLLVVSVELPPPQAPSASAIISIVVFFIAGIVVTPSPSGWNRGR